MLSIALFDEQSAWIDVTTAKEAVVDWADISHYETIAQVNGLRWPKRTHGSRCRW